MSSIGAINIGLTVSAENMSADISRHLDNMGTQMEAGSRRNGVAAGEGIKLGILDGIKVGFGVEIASRLFDGAIAAVQGIASTLVSTIQSGMALASELAIAASETGVSAASLLTLKEAAHSVGADFDLLTDSIKETWLKLGEARNGEQSAIDAFSKIGLSIQSLQGLRPEEVFWLVAKSLNGMADGAMATASAAALMGDDVGLKAIPLLGQLAVAADATTARWKLLGGELANADISAAAGMQTSIEKVTATFERFSIMLSAQFAPWMEWGIAKFDEWVIASGGMSNAASVLGAKFVDLGVWVAGAAQLLYGLAQIGFGGCKFITKGVELVIAAVGWLGATWTTIFGKNLATAGSFMKKIGAGFSGLVQGFSNILISLWNGTSSLIISGINLIIKGYNKVAKFARLPLADLLDTNAGSIKEIKIDTNFLEELGSGIEDFGNGLSESASGLADSFSNVLSTLAAESETLLDDLALGLSNVVDASSADGWGASLRKQLESAKKEVDSKTQQTAARLAAPVTPAPVTSIPAPYTPKTTKVSPTASQNFNRIGPSQEPIVINQKFSSGVTPQDLKNSADQTKKETMKAVETAVGRGGNFARNIQC